MSNEITPVAVQTPQPATAEPVQTSQEVATAVKPEDVKTSGEQASVASATTTPEQGKKLDTVA